MMSVYNFRICITCSKAMPFSRTDKQTCSARCRQRLSRFVRMHGFIPSALEYSGMKTNQTRYARKNTKLSKR